MKISIVAAIGENLELGGKGNLLWRLPLDMQRFKNITLHHHVLMGRKTYESLPPKFRPLPERTNLVVSTQHNFEAEGCKVVESLSGGIEFAQKAGETDLMVIGGAQIYNHALPLAHVLHITKVHAAFPEADVFFPRWKAENWETVANEFHAADEKHKYSFEFLTLRRIASQ